MYWLKDNFEREKRTLKIRSDVTFAETIQQLQMAKLKLPGLLNFPHVPKDREDMFFDEDMQELNTMDIRPRRQIITMVNALNTKVKNVEKDSSVNRTVIISVGKKSHLSFSDTLPIRSRIYPDSNNHVFKMLYRVDSLQDSLKISEITKTYSSNLIKQNIAVPFIITRLDSAKHFRNHLTSDVTIGFAHPVTYHLLLLNTTPYLFKKILLPVLFSVFLAGITILSFVVLYRNLLRQQKLAEIKNEFISNITHELKTPIATVGVAIEALKNFNAMHDPKKTMEYLDISSNELQRLSLLVDKVLKLSMFEKKQIELNKEQFDLKELTQEVFDTMRLQFEKNKASVKFLSEGKRFIVNADKLHVTSVIYNLLDNALKYSKENPVINISLKAKPNSIELKVTDNGIGIPREYQKKIFDKFFRVPTGNKHAVKGYGLGLSYVSEIVKWHTGFISVESEVGKGSVFTVRFPVYKV